MVSDPQQHYQINSTGGTLRIRKKALNRWAKHQASICTLLRVLVHNIRPLYKYQKDAEALCLKENVKYVTM